MKLNEFHAKVAARAAELGSQYWSVNVEIKHTWDGIEMKWEVYLPEADPRWQSSANPEAVLENIGALPPATIDDDTDLSEITNA